MKKTIAKKVLEGDTIVFKNSYETVLTKKEKNGIVKIKTQTERGISTREYSSKSQLMVVKN